MAQPLIRGACCVCAFGPQTPVSWLEHTHQHAWGCVMCFLEQGGLGGSSKHAGPAGCTAPPCSLCWGVRSTAVWRGPCSEIPAQPGRASSGERMALKWRTGCGEKRRCWTCFAAGEQRQREEAAHPCCARGCLRSRAPLRSLPTPLLLAGRWDGVQEGVCRQGQPPACLGDGKRPVSHGDNASLRLSLPPLG